MITGKLDCLSVCLLLGGGCWCPSSSSYSSFISFDYELQGGSTLTLLANSWVLPGQLLQGTDSFLYWFWMQYPTTNAAQYRFGGYLLIDNHFEIIKNINKSQQKRAHTEKKKKITTKIKNTHTHKID